MSSKRVFNRTISLATNARRRSTSPITENSYYTLNASRSLLKHPIPQIRSIASSSNQVLPGPPKTLSIRSPKPAGSPLQALIRARPVHRGADIVTKPQRRHASNGSEPLARTPFYDLHVKHGAKFSPFAGYEMPLYYSDLSHAESHHWVREKCGLFDVSHMYVLPSPLSGTSSVIWSTVLCIL